MVKCTFVGQTVFPFRSGVASGPEFKSEKGYEDK